MIFASIAGRLATDPQTRQAGKGTVTEFRLPVDHGFGERKSTTWVTCSVWGKRGEKAAELLRKGSWVHVGGQLTTREYAHEGKAKTSVELEVFEWTFAGAKTRGEAQADWQAQGGSDDIPF